MSSSEGQRLDLGGLKVTEEDVRALRRPPGADPVDFAAYIRFLEGFGHADPAELRKRRGPRGPEPFTLRS